MFIKLPDTFPYKIERFRADHPGTSFPQDLQARHYAAFGVLPVTATARPAYNKATQGLDMSAEYIKGEWVQVWTVRDATQDEANTHAAVLKDEDDALAIETARADATIKYLMTHTDAQIEAKINADVTNIASIKPILSRLAVAVGALARRGLI